MTLLSKHQSNEYTKMLLEGDSGSGKTGALTSLVAAGYKLRILDFDNGLETLKAFVSRDCPEHLDNVEFRTLRDKYKASAAGPIMDGPPKAYVEAVKMLGRWRYDDVDLGEPCEWGSDHILVIDSLTFLSDAAYNLAEALNPSAKDPRQIYGAAQTSVEKVLAEVTSDNMRTNVIVISHVKYVDNPDGTRKGYPTAVGSALSPIIPRYFNTVALCQTKAGGKRTIQTAATAMIDLKNPRPFAAAKEYPIETGLAEFFSVLREPPVSVQVEPKANVRRMR